MKNLNISKNIKILLVSISIIFFNTAIAQKKYGYINLKNEVVIPAKYDHANDFVNGFAQIKIDDKWGFINLKGEIVVQPKYGFALDFENHIAKVSIAEPEIWSDDIDWLYINEKGDELDKKTVLGEPQFFDGLKLIKTKDKKYGFENTAGKMVIPAIYDYAADFNGYGWAAVKKGDFMGCINSKGAVIVPFCSSFIDISFGKFIAVNTYNGEVRIYDINGKYKKIDGADKIYNFSKSGIASFKSQGKNGFIATNGKILVPAVYDDVGSSDFDALAKVKKDGQIHVLDILNNKILCSLPDVKGYHAFKNEMANVVINDKYGLIDKFGKTIIPATYSSLGCNANSGLIYFSEIQKNTVVAEIKNVEVPKAVIPTTTTYTSGNVSTSSFALDIFSELGSIAIYKGSMMYVVKIKGKQMQDQGTVAARANQLLGFTTAFKYQWFAGNNCTTLKSQYGGNFTVICQGEIDLDK